MNRYVVDMELYRVVQNYWYCEGKYGCGVCLTPPKSYMSFFFHKNNIFQHFTSRKFPKYCAKFWKIMSVNWIILHPYFRNDNFSKDRNYSFLIEISFTKLSWNLLLIFKKNLITKLGSLVHFITLTRPFLLFSWSCWCQYLK